MNPIKRYSLSLVFMCLTTTILAHAAVDSPEALNAARNYAMGLIENGQRLEAATYLLQTLRDIPRDRADLALPAIGAVQLLMFDNEYLMFDAEREALYDGTLDEENSEMDLFLATLMRYVADTGMTQEEVNQCARDLTKLAGCEHLAVRVGALFLMSDPYYFYDTGLAQQARDDILKFFPDVDLAQEAQRLSLYYARGKGAQGLKEVMERTTDKGELRSHSLRMQADSVGSAIHQAIDGASSEEADAACVAGLAAKVRSAADPIDVYAALNVLEGFHETSSVGDVSAAASDAIARNIDPRCTFRARVIRMSVARVQGDADLAFQDADALLRTDPIPVVPDRNNYEEIKNSIQQTADFLAQQGRNNEARQLLRDLAGRFPGTLLFTKVEEKMAVLSSPVEDVDQ